MLKLQRPLTMYVARHSWASAAKAKNVPLSVISEGMGHDSEATTQIYLASLETSVVDKANKMILVITTDILNCFVLIIIPVKRTRNGIFVGRI